MEDAERMKKISNGDHQADNEADNEDESEITEIRLASREYEEIKKGVQRFLLLKQKGYTLGQAIALQEYKSGKKTGQELITEAICIMEDMTGIEDGYCILGFEIVLDTSKED
jgi:hypothetical protein